MESVRKGSVCHPFSRVILPRVDNGTYISLLRLQHWLKVRFIPLNVSIVNATRPALAFKLYNIRMRNTGGTGL